MSDRSLYGEYQARGLGGLERVARGGQPKPPWKKKNPKPKSKRGSLTPAQKAEAKRRAKAAGRPYPNLVDNMAVSKAQGGMAQLRAATAGYAKGGKSKSKGSMKGMTVKGGYKRPVSEGAGLTAKGRASINRRTGSNLKAPAPNPKTKEAKARKKSFCARSRGWTGERGKAARRRWNC